MEGVLTLLETNTLLGGKIPETGNIFKQLDVASALCYPFPSSDDPSALLFSGVIWDNLDSMIVTREVFGAQAFNYRTALYCWANGVDPYSFCNIKKYKLCLGLSTFPDRKAVFMPNSFKDPKEALAVVNKYAKPEDTSIVVVLDGLKKIPHFTVRSVFNPYFAYLRAEASGVHVSPDLIAEAAKTMRIPLKHKDTQAMEHKIITEGFSPLVGLSILAMKDGEADAVVVVGPEGYPYHSEYTEKVSVQAQEQQSANPSGFEI